MTQPPIKPEDPTPSPADDARPAPDRERDASEAFAAAAARLLNDYKCADILVFDVRGVSPITNFIVIASGTSDRQIRSLAKHVADLGEQTGFDRYGDDADKAATWLAIDFVEVMVHLFEPETRGHYDLEMLWGDAPEINWRRKAQ